MNEKEFNNLVHRMGISSSVLLFLLMISFPVIISSVYDVWPQWATAIPAMISLLLMMAPWWPGETIGYMTTMGPGALYLAYITGNVTTLRMPVTVGTMNALNLKPNTDECHTMAIIACGASNFTTIIVLFIGILLSVPLQPILNAPKLQPAFNFALPALFGGMVAQTIIKDKKTVGLYLIPLGICCFFGFCTGLNIAYYMLITVLTGALVFYLFDYYFKRS